MPVLTTARAQLPVLRRLIVSDDSEVWRGDTPSARGTAQAGERGLAHDLFGDARDAGWRAVCTYTRV